ncbi:hypothetical protein EIN_085960 [Entamoeba invadens IP1]|uniref:hypothetical protein n=1 Tax=Entamoeba invadens IP1 TaxID=370355 RepID=UPI0002C3F235|nr:hypothetical protein EIN_085960 [Entamoeba invadens IP1]ELP85344.1 hypothetical protein EIN_085960 [Entamoeba invadens IP1]|eukprot:XP_004184690.1 hypothetical protein EIN_085960 [Entamoeba invadens IP1]
MEKVDPLKTERKSYQTLDSYSLMIVSKYFEDKNDYINIVQVCRKFRFTLEKFRFNPIPITSHKLFPNIETLVLYSSDDNVFDTPLIRVEYNVVYSHYKKMDQTKTQYKRVVFNQYERRMYRGVIFDGVTTLTPRCFENCSVDDISIPPSVRSIGEFCFYKCYKTKTLTVPGTIKIIPLACFKESLFSSIEICRNVRWVENNAFEKCTQLTSLIFPNTIERIGKMCCSQCLQLKNLVLPNSIPEIPPMCFQYCSTLREVVLSESVRIIGNFAFRNCKGLLQVDFGDMLSYIGESAFENCISLQKVRLKADGVYIGKFAFKNCVSLCEVQTTKGANIEKSCFEGCKLLFSYIEFHNKSNAIQV